MNTHSDSEKTTAEKIGELIKANSKKIIVLSVLVVLTLVLVGVYDSISTHRNDKALMVAEDIEDLFNQWNESAEADKAAVSTELQELIESTLADYDGTYAALRANYTKGLLFSSEEKWEESMAAFLAITEEFPESYIASTSLFNAASIADQSGDTEQALSFYESIVEKFTTSSADIPETLFNIGRLNEELGKADSAVKSYQKIIDEYSSSSWTNIAKSRIISINANS
ncbi:MAG: hypothetical protein B6241_07190 [Spirochaetaceae bacterium 4572_59]|nr:MAG: hypothetical protein B6241_07190 [Spirochaetaceae bacterium 4572_59]